METVSFFTFLEEKITEILFQLFFLALVAFLLIFYGVDMLFVVLLVILFISIQGLFQWCLYRKKRKASQHIIDTLLMYYFLEMTESEIANLQKITQSGVFRNRHHALETMKKILKEEH